MHPRIVCQQSDPMWLPSRRGCISASRHSDVDNYRKDGQPGADYFKYRSEVVAEWLTDWAADHPTTYWMKRGQEEEPNAIAVFEARYGVFLTPPVLIEHESIERWLATPDGLISRRESIEVKVPAPHNYINWVDAGVIPVQHIPQMVAQQVVADLEMTVFIAYCPDFPPAQQLFIREFRASEEQRDIATTRAEHFLKEAAEIVERMMAAKYDEPLTFEG